jgi:hypothetical protein
VTTPTSKLQPLHSMLHRVTQFRLVVLLRIYMPVLVLRRPFLLPLLFPKLLTNPHSLRNQPGVNHSPFQDLPSLSMRSIIILSSFLIGLASSRPIHTLHKRIPAALYQAGEYALKAQGGPIVALDNQINVHYQDTDANLVVYGDGGIPKWQSGVDLSSAGCENHNCMIVFQTDGNFVSYFDGVPTWETGTAGRGKSLVFFDIEPYIVVYDANEQPIWHTPITSPASPPAPPAQSSVTPPNPVSVHIVQPTAHPGTTTMHSATPPVAPPATPPVAPPATPSGDPHVVPVTPITGSSADHVVEVPPSGNSGNGGSGNIDDGSGNNDDGSGVVSDFGDPAFDFGGGDDFA